MLTKQLIEDAIRVVKSKIAHSTDADREAWAVEEDNLEDQLPLVGGVA